MSQSLCTRCSHVKEVVSGSGSRFLLCQLSFTDPRFSKYPPQPIANCSGFKQEDPPTNET